MHKKNTLNNRPVNLDLKTIKFPITAIISILHRISGFALFIVTPLMLWLWQYSISSSTNYNKIIKVMNLLSVKLLVWVTIMGLIYHMLAGFRHILMDNHIGDSKQGGRLGAYFVLILTIILAVLWGAFLWS